MITRLANAYGTEILAPRGIKFAIQHFTPPGNELQVRARSGARVVAQSG